MKGSIIIFEHYNKTFLLIPFLILYVLSNFIFTKIIKKRAQLIYKKEKFNNLVEYINNIELLYDEMRKFKHDYINILSSMSEYIRKGDMEELRSYFEDNIISISNTMCNENFQLDKLKNIKILELKGIISTKIIKAQALGANIFIDIPNPVIFINMDLIDLIRVIGILLDNAIESTIETQHKLLELGIIDTKNYWIMIVSNSCEQDIPPLFKIYENKFSTKNKDRGLGLNILKSIVSKYSNIYIDTSIEDNVFKQTLKIKKL